MNKTDRVPPALRKLLDFDENLTKNCLLYANKLLPIRNYRIYYKGLEFSCHGIPWFAFWITFTWLFNNTSLIQMQVNMLLGLFLDIILVAITKAYFRRKRPISNTDDALGQMGPDVFSFPSGHASRAVFVAIFFGYLYPLHVIWIFLVSIWTMAVCISRFLLSRHYILDVLGGVLLGLINGGIMGVLWLEDDSAKWLMSFLSDEKIDGGDYHV